MAQINLQEFIAKWTGRGLDFDGAYGPQCFDLFHQYHVEVLGVSDGRTLSAPAARDIFTNFESLHNNALFEKIANTPEGVPQKGDIVIWTTGQFGHVAIFLEGDANRFTSFDQNWPVGSKCHIQEHTYDDVLGWVRFKGITDTAVEQIQKELQTQISATDICQLQLKTALEQATLFQKQVDSYNSQLTDTKLQLEDYKRKYEDSQRQVIDLKTEIAKVYNEDKDSAVEALDAQHLADERGKLIKSMADQFQISYDPTDDKKVVEELLKEMTQLQNAPSVQDVGVLQNVAKLLVAMGINTYLNSRSIAPVDPDFIDAEFEAKVATYLDAVTQALLNPLTPEPTPTTTPLVTRPKQNVLFNLIVKFVFLFASPK